MARSIQDNLNQMMEVKSGEQDLTQLTSTSKVSIYRLFMYVISVMINAHEQSWELFKKKLEQIADESNIGTPQWLQRMVLLYQHGSTLVVNNDTVVYNTIDESKKIITRCAVKENDVNRTVIVKVAKDSAGSLTKLTDDEVAGLRSYIRQIKMAGTKIIVTTMDADRVAVNVEIYYDAAYLPADVKAGVIAAINNYFKELDFSGTVYISRLQDSIQAVIGVKDVVVHNMVCRIDTDAIGNATTIERFYESFAGYVLPESTTGYTLEDTIIMHPFE
jgi:hypothetical protein